MVWTLVLLLLTLYLFVIFVVACATYNKYHQIDDRRPIISMDDNGWHLDILLAGAQRQERVTTMQFYSYRLQIRDDS